MQHICLLSWNKVLRESNDPVKQKINGASMLRLAQSTQKVMWDKRGHSDWTLLWEQSKPEVLSRTHDTTRKISSHAQGAPPRCKSNIYPHCLGKQPEGHIHYALHTHKLSVKLSSFSAESHSYTLKTSFVAAAESVSPHHWFTLFSIDSHLVLLFQAGGTVASKCDWLFWFNVKLGDSGFK